MNEEDQELLERAAGSLAHPAWTSLSEEALRQVVLAEGIDFATALLYDRLVRSPEHGPFIGELANLPEPSFPLSERAAPTVVIVPGGFYREDQRSGADGRFVLEAAAQLGFRTERIRLSSFGALRENAATIRSWVRKRPDESMVLVSLSKGGAEMKLALAAPDAAEVFRNVTAWISLSGLCAGTPLVGWLFRQGWRLPMIRLFFWCRGYHYPALRELERGPNGLLNFKLSPPSHVQVIHVVGFPLIRHLSTPLAGRGHRRISPLGPNDGGPILLADLQHLPGLIYPVWGADHYLQPAWDTRHLLKRLLYYVTQGRARAVAG